MHPCIDCEKLVLKKSLRCSSCQNKIKRIITDETRNKIRQNQLGKKYSKESRIKMSLSKIGDKNPNWKGGITPYNVIIRTSSKYREWSLSVFKRDNFICQSCGYINGGILEAHHIRSFAKYPNLRYILDNGITLCKKCHKIVHKYNLINIF